MAKIDTSKIPGYAEMSAEDKLKALEGFESVSYTHLAPGKLRRLLRRSCGDSLSRSHTGLSIHGFCHTNTSKHKRIY